MEQLEAGGHIVLRHTLCSAVVPPGADFCAGWDAAHGWPRAGRGGSAAAPAGSRPAIAYPAGYLTTDEFFTANPEAGRQLAVLTFLEKAIQEYWDERAAEPIADWDRSFPKFEFNTLWPKYVEWYQKQGCSKLYIAPPPFAPQAWNKSA